MFFRSPPVLKAPGTIVNLNTIESFKDFDKQRFIHEKGAIVSSLNYPPQMFGCRIREKTPLPSLSDDTLLNEAKSSVPLRGRPFDIFNSICLMTAWTAKDIRSFHVLGEADPGLGVCPNKCIQLTRFRSKKQLRTIECLTTRRC